MCTIISCRIDIQIKTWQDFGDDVKLKIKSHKHCAIIKQSLIESSIYKQQLPHIWPGSQAFHELWDTNPMPRQTPQHISQSLCCKKDIIRKFWKHIKILIRWGYRNHSYNSVMSSDIYEVSIHKETLHFYWENHI